MLEKTYRPAEVEAKHYARWEQAGAFAADPGSGKPPYTIMMPPPNVTGSLHIGHGLTFTVQDVLVRFHRMAGRDVLWQPGTDHAGIATQMVVERQLGEQGIGRRQLGREKFLERVWEWKEQSGGTIIKQLRHLGASADWQRERFTMDEGLSHAVRKVFVDLYRQGLRHFLIISGHASSLQISCLTEVGEELLLKYPDIRVAVLSILNLGMDGWHEIIVTEDDSHAGEVETSVMLHLRPQLVGEARPREWPRFPRHLLVRDKLRYWPGGVWGDASQATRKKGQQLFDLSVTALVQLVQDLDGDGYLP